MSNTGITVRIKVSTQQTEDLFEWLKIETKRTTTAELLIEIHSNDYRESIDVLLEKLGRPDTVEVDCRTAEFNNEEKVSRTRKRQEVFEYVLSKGFRRKYLSPFVAQPNGRNFQAVKQSPESYKSVPKPQLHK